jgi:2-polyprenyl-3-methyl-5-hydroxy-6-metoxy-1,4-benzoquinol methylase
MHTCSPSVLPIHSVVEFNNALYGLRQCTVCGYKETRPQEAVVVDIYETGHYEVKPLFLIPFLINLPDYLYISLILKRRGIKAGSTILDFGCGKGFFLYLLKKLNYKNINGLETSVSRAGYAGKLTELDISTSYYSEGMIMNKKYDCITMIHVLEHIENPFAFGEIMMRDALNENGCLFIEVPNINSVASKIAGKVWAHFTPHFHINHFTTQSFENFCQRNNFKYELISTFSFYNSTMGMTSAILFLFGYKGSLFEDMKNKKWVVALSFLILLPVTLILEMLISLFMKRGSVIKCMIKKK